MGGQCPGKEPRGCAVRECECECRCCSSYCCCCSAVARVPPIVLLLLLLLHRRGGCGGRASEQAPAGSGRRVAQHAAARGRDGAGQRTPPRRRPRRIAIAATATPPSAGRVDTGTVLGNIGPRPARCVLHGRPRPGRARRPRTTLPHTRLRGPHRPAAPRLASPTSYAPAPPAAPALPPTPQQPAARYAHTRARPLRVVLPSSARATGSGATAYRATAGRSTNIFTRPDVGGA